MRSSQRRCGTCRHFQPAPLWRKGWCRNPLLYAPHQNHLVDERDLDCDRHFGDYWEPIEVADDPESETEVTQPVQAPAPPEPPSSAPAERQRRSAAGAGSAAATSGAARPAARRAATPPAGQRPRRSTQAPSRTRGTVPPPRSRSDYLRIGVPVVVILLLLLGYTIWTTLLFRSAAAPASPTAPVLVAATATVPVVAGVPTLAPTSTPVQSTVAPTATAAPPTATPAPPTPTAEPTVGPTAVPTLRPGGTAVVDTGASGQGLRLRAEPDQDSRTLLSIRPGQEVELLDGPRQAGGISWWKVQYRDQTGWVAGEFLRPAA